MNNTVRFGPFEADLGASELRKNGIRIRVQELPFRILTLLLERPGEIVAREEIQKALWPDGTFVEFEHSLNTAVNKLRAALSDDADLPRYIETIPRRGYRFVGSLIVPPPPQLRAQPPDERRRPAWTWLAVLLIPVAMIPIWWLASAKPKPVRRLALNGPENVADLLISPDGRRIAYAGGQPRRVWIQDLDNDQPRLIPRLASKGEHLIAWSRNSEFLVLASDEKIRTVSAAGTPVRTILSPRMFARASRGDWSPDGERILWNPVSPARIFEVPASGGEAREMKIPEGQANGEYLWPHYLPGGDRILFQETLAGRNRIFAWEFESARRQFVADGEKPIYASSGHVLYEWMGSVWAMSFSTSSLKRTGEPVMIEPNATHASVADEGTLVFLGHGKQLQQLVWVDRNGKDLELIGQAQSAIAVPTLSPDGSRVLVLAGEGHELNVWVHDIVRGLKTRLTFDPGQEDRPSWMPDGKRFSFTTARGSVHSASQDIYVQNADGSGKPERLIATPHPEWSMGWSRDGRYLIFDRIEGRYSDIWYLQRNADGLSEEKPFIRTENDELSPCLSPDGKFLAYESNKSGRMEVYVRSFPAGDSEMQVSVQGGGQPRWRGDGRELFFVQSGDTMTSVMVQDLQRRQVSAPKILFRYPDALRGRGQRYDVTPDGQKFVLVKTLQPAQTVIRVVENWLTEFEARRHRK